MLIHFCSCSFKELFNFITETMDKMDKRDDFATMSITQLKNKCKGIGITNFSEVDEEKDKDEKMRMLRGILRQAEEGKKVLSLIPKAERRPGFDFVPGEVITINSDSEVEEEHETEGTYKKYVKPIEATDAEKEKRADHVKNLQEDELKIYNGKFAPIHYNTRDIIEFANDFQNKMIVNRFWDYMEDKRVIKKKARILGT